MLSANDANSVASLIKLYLRELRESVFPFYTFDRVIDCAKSATIDDFVSKVGGEARGAPDVYRPAAPTADERPHRQAARVYEGNQIARTERRIKEKDITLYEMSNKSNVNETKNFVNDSYS